MEEVIEKLSEITKRENLKVVKINHVISKEITQDNLNTISVTENSLLGVQWYGNEDNSGQKWEFNLIGSNFPDQFYIDISKFLAECGCGTIKVTSQGWSLKPSEENSKQATLRIHDHIACRLPSPLTGTEMARRGEVFIDMKCAYILDSEKTVCSDSGTILWHTENLEKPDNEEIMVALDAGCSVASGGIAPWAVCGMAFGIEVEASVVCQLFN